MRLNKMFAMLSVTTLIAAQVPCNIVMAEALENTDSVRRLDSEKTIEAYVEAVQRKDWSTFIDLECSSEQESASQYFADESNTNGIKQVEEILLKGIYEVDNSLAEGEMLKVEYPILIDNDTVQSFIVALDCTVNKENQYFFNGVNYFLTVLAEEDGEMKIVQFNRPSVEMLEQVVVPALNAARADCSDEIAGINVIRQAERGLVINADDEILTEGFLLVGVSDNEGEAISIHASGTTDFEILGSYEYYSYPSTITVYMDKEENKVLLTVDFETYLKNTLPNEWMGVWSTESLRAGAYCVKMVGWYRTIKPYCPKYGRDVAQTTQWYRPNSSYPTTNNAVAYVEGYGMANSEGKLFFPEYARGEEGSAGTQHSGKLTQYGSKYLASEKNYYHEAILNYYYSGSHFSDGDLVFFYYDDNVH